MNNVSTEEDQLHQEDREILRCGLQLHPNLPSLLLAGGFLCEMINPDCEELENCAGLIGSVS